MQIVCLGDFMVCERVADHVREHGIDDLVAHLKAMIAPADVAIANFEFFVCAPGVPPRTRNHAVPEAVGIAARAGFDAVSVASNHAWDEGDEAIVHTLRGLNAAGVETFGLGDETGGEPQPVVIERKGVRLGLLAYASTSMVGTKTRFRAAMPTIARLRADVAALADRCDVLLVSIHHGFGNYPSPEHRAWARAAVEAGADAVVSHHTHMLSGFEGTGGSVAAYGLGDVVAPFLQPRLREGLCVRLDVADGRVAGWRCEPVLFDERGFPSRGDEAARSAVLARLDEINRNLARPDYELFYWSCLPRDLGRRFLKSWARDLRTYGLWTFLAKIRNARWYHLCLLWHMLLDTRPGRRVRRLFGKTDGKAP